MSLHLLGENLIYRIDLYPQTLLFISTYLEVLLYSILIIYQFNKDLFVTTGVKRK